MNSVMAAVPRRMAVSTLGPSTGLAMRSIMNEAPHKAESASSWKKYLIFTARVPGAACQWPHRAARERVGSCFHSREARP
jgi:hypothetical protein